MLEDQRPNRRFFWEYSLIGRNGINYSNSFWFQINVKDQ